jgi:S-(hydroxymethyl)glutathione dehydrogenase/alcohol dehydrogenase
VGALAELTTVGVHSVIKVDKDLPLERICLLGCGVGTGWGSAVNSANAGPGDTIIVMGVGGVGINAVQGAVHAGASHVIAVDPFQMKRDMARKLGATRAFGDIAEAGDFARSVTNGQGADAAIVTVGVVNGELVGQAFRTVRKGGTCVVTGLGKLADVGVAISLGELTLFQKRLQGALFGACSPNADIPRQIQMYRDGRLNLDDIVTHEYSLSQAAQGYEDMHAGKNIRGIVRFDI